MNKIEDLINKYIAQLLKRNGFRKKKLSWNRTRNNLIDVIEFQDSKGSSNSFERFTINIGVFVPELYEIVWNKPLKGFANEVDCVVRCRLGELIQNDFSGQALDTWWELGDHEKIGDELQSIFENKLIPFFDSMKDLSKLHEFINNSKGWQKEYPLMQIYYSLLENSLGNKVASTKYLQKIISGDNNAWSSRAKEVESRIT